MTTTYCTIVNGETVYQGPDQEYAIRSWDHHTVATRAAGGVSVQTFNDEGIMVRDGWLLHVNSTGNVYLNPRI